MSKDGAKVELGGGNGSPIFLKKILSIYIYITETFEAPTNFHVSIILKNKKIKNVIKL